MILADFFGTTATFPYLRERFGSFFVTHDSR